MYRKGTWNPGPRTKDEVQEQKEPDMSESKPQAVPVAAPAVPSDVDITISDDIPLPEVMVDKTIKDTFDGAFRFAFIGAGQGGSRIAQAFHQLGYKRVCALNTAQQDMATITLPDANKLVLGQGGAGKNPRVAREVVAAHREDVLDFMRRSFGPTFDRIFVCVGAGGGTGNGACMALLDIAKEVMESLRLPVKLGVVVALPKNSEGRTVAANAHELLSALFAKVKAGEISPMIVLDNERIQSIYPGLAVDPFWDTANRSVASLFHLFNTIAIKPSHYTSFDQADYSTLLDSGMITFGATPVAKWDDPTDISHAVRDNLRRNMLAGGVDLATGAVAGAIIIGGQGILAKIPQTHLDHAFEQLSRVLKGGNTVHRGIYRGNKETLVVYTMIGGLGEPEQRLTELRKLGGIL